ncbi:GntR family transcriptional regulator [Lysinibacter sp. HNR]|uniref:FadR/GntR family transcriptional regulator n=1 Tax=Lysinibacter sp. HNR TaxID=3031408 RepID=UPI002435C10F|nr:GntR family transcriptional regulator [Lysinibacter sp. HNR]WGD37436.1 GntR family transcriptional regulator [Lysinibacter sp. HNR]
MDDVKQPPAPPGTRSRESSATTVAGILRKRIALGGFTPGERLPTERELAAALDVSRNTVREAIRSLAAEGVVETTLGRGGGSRVLEPPTDLANDRAFIAAEFREMLRDHMEYRRIIEPAAARLAAERGSTAIRKAIVDLLDQEVPDLSAYHRVDTNFHLLIAEASGNPVLHRAVADARTELFLSANTLWFHSDWHSVYGERTSLADVFRLEHASVAAAIMAEDGAAAERYMRGHLSESEEQFGRLLLALES